MRFLPVLDQGELRARASLWAIAYLTHPESEQDAIRIANCLVAENEAMEAGLQDGYGELGKAANKMITKNIKKARLAGDVLYQMILNTKNRGAPDYRKAVFAVSEWASTVKTASGGVLPSDGNRLRKEIVRKFSSAAHYWAAFDMLENEEQVLVTDDHEVFAKWMVLSAKIQDEVERLKIPSVDSPFNGWQPWRVPLVYHCGIGSYDIQLPEETEEISRRIENYKNKSY